MWRSVVGDKGGMANRKDATKKPGFFVPVGDRLPAYICREYLVILQFPSPLAKNPRSFILTQSSSYQTPRPPPCCLR